MTAQLGDFDPAHHADEVIERWGQDAYDRSATWWTSLGESGRADFMSESSALGDAWNAAAADSLSVESDAIRDLVVRHAAWITRAWGGVVPTREQLVGLADMYVADPRFAANYGGEAGATFVRNAIVRWAV